MTKKISDEQIRFGLMLLIVFICMMTFAWIQPFGDGPDEINRFKVVEYIYHHGTLPVGDDPEILLDGYGGSYAFQPILTYMIDGYLLRAFSFLEPSLETRVLISRMVNVLIGCIAAVYTKLLADRLFNNRSSAWLFALAVVFLPQNLFIHTYVNTDSMGLLSIAMILYTLLKGQQDNFSKKTCIHLAIGIILCALSYYNCYGIVLCAMLFMIVYFRKDCKALIQKSIFISVIVLIGIAWWFIRNALLYNGDFLGMEARAVCAANTCLEQFNPATRDTYRSLGIPLMEMVFGTDYFTLVWKSFIAMFGPMLIPTHHYIYMAFKDLFWIALISLCIPIKDSVLTASKNSQKWLVHGIMILSILIPSVLALFYSYGYDFQPQGRYYLPIVIPLMYFLTIGMEKLIRLISLLFKRILSGIYTASKQDTVTRLGNAFLYHLLYAFLTLSLLYATFVSMVGYYRQ